VSVGGRPVGSSPDATGRPGVAYDSILSRISSTAEPGAPQWSQAYLGVFFTSLATLILELALTRIFSVVFYYHFAFLAISIALFGLGVGGVFSYVLAGWPGRLFSKLGTVASLASVAVVLSLIYLLSLNGQPGNWTLALVYFLSALPFFLAGAVISLAISETIQRVERVYFFDLLGAAAGCLALVPLLNGFGGPNAVLAAAILYAVSAAIWYSMAERITLRAAAVGLALVLVALFVFNSRSPIIDVKYAKGQALAGEKFVKWNSSSRVALAPEKDSGRPSIFIDADASTGIPNYDFAHLSDADREDLLYHGPGLPYVLRPGAKTLIIGAGGGWDLARALASGSRDITGVEINPIIADTIMRERFPDLSRRLYFRPEVRIVVEDGRSFARRSKEHYQTLQLTLVDTWAATAAGAFALSESTLYTTDAFQDYLNRLTGDGMMVFTRWGFDPPRESLRLLSLAREALGRLGEKEAWRNVMVLREGTSEQLARWGTMDTVLISRHPFPAADVARMREAAARGHIQIIYLPGDRAANPFGELLLSAHPSSFLRNYPYDITAVSDNRPFFFYTVQPRDLWEFVRHASQLSADYKVNRAVPLLFTLVMVSLVAVVIILALPPLVLGSRLPRGRGVRRFLVYFVLIGIGYILIQVALIQKFVLFLGHPTYALTVIIFSMLLSSGVGSFCSRKIIAGDSSRLRAALAGVAVLVSMMAFLVTPLTSAAVGWPRVLKVLITVCLTAPTGFLMGMPFPVGLERMQKIHAPSVRWAWSLNAAASVLGSVSAICLAIYLGLRETLLVGGAAYLVAIVFAAQGRLEHKPQ
jgi:hypothetical protein